jgi:regulator of RNase E activity RraA
MKNPLAVLEGLRRFDTATVCNVLEITGLRSKTEGYADPRIKALFPKLSPMVGFAVTAAFRACEPTMGVPVYQSLVDQIGKFADLPGPAVPVFQDLDDPATAATFGEVMCTTYVTFGAAGLVTSGCARDLPQVERLNFPCFASGVMAAHGYCHMPFHDIPVRIGGLIIHPGDLLHGDANGLTTIPLLAAPHVPWACERYMEAEAIVMDHLKAGMATPDSFAEAMRLMRSSLEKLGEELRAKIASEN